MSKSDKGRLPPGFIVLLPETIDSPAWRAMSHGAKALYVALKRRVNRGSNRGYISYRHAAVELKSSPRKIGEWFNELEHYGFIALAVPGSLGVEGKGKSPQWRLTENGNASKKSASGVFEDATKDFLRWGGTPFRPKRKKQNPASYGVHTPLPTGEAVPLPTGETPQAESASYGVDIERGEGASYGVGITRLTTSGPLPASDADPRITALGRTERRRKPTRSASHDTARAEAEARAANEPPESPAFLDRRVKRA